ncbi:hypothetical protein [Sphaerisporangium dianthi]|uniref:Uncharacterized protein n=1 Tax=Sphaerisporangium dianthi TaxID=1436120 RepID=A0ABV9CIQ0_9ACTN
MDTHRERPVLRGLFAAALLWGRVLLLVVMLWDVLMSALTVDPPIRPTAEFRAALRTGEVTYAIVEESEGALRDLRWSTGALAWHRAGLSLPGDGYAQAELRKDLGAVRVLPPIDWRDTTARRNNLIPRWPFDIPVPYGGWLPGAAWVLTFLVMLGTPRPRLGNRWAWFWVFTVGQVGAIMFVALEPRPLWRAIAEDRPASSRMAGGQGCAFSILVGFASGIAFFGVGDAVEMIRRITGS